MNRVPEVPDLNARAAAIAAFAIPFCRMPHPEVVGQFAGAVFPAVRDMRRRETTEVIDGRKVMWDDNTTPRWALLWSHGIPDTGHPKGWTFAHVWGAGKDPNAYTHLANLVLMPEALASLSDKDGPLCRYFRFHAENVYGWCPDRAVSTTKPEGYDTLNWEYLDGIPDAKGFVESRIDQLNSKRVKLIREIWANGE